MPRGRVVTYGQVAAMVGLPRTARQVGWTAHWGDETIPWQRVLNRHGGLASGYPGGRAGHAAALADEDIAVNDDGTVDLPKYQWWPDEATLTKLEVSEESREWLERRLPYSTRSAS